MAKSDRSVISVREAEKYFPIREGTLQRVVGNVKAVDGVSFEVRPGETVGLVGESGCGKTTLGRCITGLVPTTGGSIYFRLSDQDAAFLDTVESIPEPERSREQQAEVERIDTNHRIDQMGRRAWRTYRRNCQIVFQDSFSSLNPRHLVKDLVGRPLRVYKEASGQELTDRVVELLESVGLGRQHLYRFPHQFSGGQRQRISIARALALDPEFIVLDEPTSALDVSVQAQILNLLHDLQKERGLTYLFISHDLGVVRLMSDRVAVMYLGKVAEYGTAEELFQDPRHPYTDALLAANPDINSAVRDEGSAGHGPRSCQPTRRLPVPHSLPRTPRRYAAGKLTTSLPGFTPTTCCSAVSPTSSGGPTSTPLSSSRTRPPHRSWATSAESGDMPPAMKAALEELSIDDRKIHIRFAPVEPVELEDIGGGHLTACVLHTSRAASG